MNQSSKKVLKPTIKASPKQMNANRSKRSNKRSRASVPLPARSAPMVSERAIAAPSAIGSIQGGSRPNISSLQKNGDLRIRVRHREYVQDIVGSVAFANQQININPGLNSLFPWLAALAGLFESYQMNALKFQFRTESPSTQAGKALLSVDWDVLDPSPTSKTQMLQERTKADGPTWENFDLICDLSDLLKFGVQRFVRSGLNPAGSDLKTYDIGMLNVASQGCTSAPTIGELWVEYDVELITPNTAPLPISSHIASGSAVSNAAIFGTSPVVLGNLNVTASGSTLVFNTVGQYLVEVFASGTLTAMTSNTGTATVVVSNSVVGNATNAFVVDIISVTAPGQTVIYTGAVGTVTATATRVAAYNTLLG